jgi:phytoene dehydrogenase-like protein
MARHFDAIVVGSGLGGLTAGALYARSGARVLVLERSEVCGGAATVYRHGPLAIEASLHEIDGLDSDDPKLPILRSLGLDRNLAFVDVGDLYEVRGPQMGTPFALPMGAEQALRAATTRFPHQAQALAEYFRRLIDAREAVAFAAKHRDETGFWLRHASEAVRRLWPLLREGRATVSEVLDELFGADETIKLTLAANLYYFHDDPGQMPFLRFAIPQASYLLGGGHYVRGGSQALSDRLVSLIREANGVVQTSREVDKLIFEDDRLVGVGHHGRGHVDACIEYAPVVFGNAAPERLAQMMPEHQRRVFLAPYARRHPSISLWTMALGLSRPPAEFGVRCYSTFILPPWLRALSTMRDAGAILGEETGEHLPPYSFVDYHRIDSGLNPTAPYLGALCGIDRVQNWANLSAEAKQTRKVIWMDRLIADLDREFPGIAKAVVHREMATAETLANYLNAPQGAVYGFAPDREAGSSLAMSARTAVEGLWLASAYVFGGGYTGAMLGGATAAREAMRATEGRVKLAALGVLS